MKQNKQRKHKGWKRLRRPLGESEKTGIDTEQQIRSLARNQTNNAGIIRPETGDLHLPSDLSEPGYGQQAGGPPRVMLIIITLSLIFIAIIAYLVSQMPKKD